MLFGVPSCPWAWPLRREAGRGYLDAAADRAALSAVPARRQLCLCPRRPHEEEHRLSVKCLEYLSPAGRLILGFPVRGATAATGAVRTRCLRGPRSAVPLQRAVASEVRERFHKPGYTGTSDVDARGALPCLYPSSW